MRYLADTHVLIWSWRDPEKLSRRARKILEDGESEIWLSIASVWEMTIKSGIGKLDLEMSIAEFAKAQMQDGLQLLPIRLSHAERLAELPLHHRDPFDRMLIAQSDVEGFTVITSDGAFGDYEIKTLW